MTSRPPGFGLQRLHPFFQFLVLTGLCLVGSSIFLLLAFSLCNPMYHLRDIDVLLNDAAMHPELYKGDMLRVNAMKFVQLMASLGTFLVPALVFAAMQASGPDFFRLRQKTSLVLLLLAIVIVPLASPLIDVIYSWNQQLRLPGFMSHLQHQIEHAETNADGITTLFLQMPHWYDLLFSLLLVGILPALGEEFIFRGCLIRIFKRWTRSYHAAVWISAAIFSFIHFQFLGFVPRMLLGALFGYLYYWSGTLWVPILAHLVTNGAQVIFTYLFQHHLMQQDLGETGQVPATFLVLTAMLFTAALYYFYKKARSQQHFLTFQP